MTIRRGLKIVYITVVIISNISSAEFNLMPGSFFIIMFILLFFGVDMSELKESVIPDLTDATVNNMKQTLHRCSVCTLAAIAESEYGKGKIFSCISDLMADLQDGGDN